VKRPPLHAQEEFRLEALHRARLLDTPPEAAIDRLARLAAHVTGCPIALFSLVDRDRQWFKSKHGLEGSETPRDESFCAHAVASEQPLVVADATRDPRFHDNPSVIADPRIRFYAGVPVRSEEGLPLGTLCVLDRVPRELASEQMGALTALAHEMETQLTLRTALDEAEKAREDRSQLTALLVHDLRNPLTAVIAGAACLEMDPDLSESSREIVLEMIEAGRRMQRMAFQLLDESTHSRSGLVVSTAAVDPSTFYRQVCSALTLNARLTGHRLDTSFTSDAGHGETVTTDEGLLRRLLDNLLDNALKFSPLGSEVRFRMSVRRSEPMTLEVVDAGPGVPESERERIFDAGVRLHDPKVGEETPRQRGWGLGLRFCRRAAEALGGTIAVGDAAGGGAVFTVKLPGLAAR
jgi:signal transduction histidine kinase